jgi:hypothetical protein
MMHTSSATTEVIGGRGSCLWELTLAVAEQTLAGRLTGELFVEVQGEEAGSYYRKETRELSPTECQPLHPVLREHVVELLLDQQLAEQDHVDLLQRWRAYAKKFEELVQQDQPALIDADRRRADEECPRSASGVRRGDASGRGGVPPSRACSCRDDTGEKGGAAMS